MEQVKVWHDDIRKPPNSEWMWVRTNDEAKAILNTYDVTEMSLDHDLGLEHVESNTETIFLRGTSPAGTGYDLVKWMCETNHIPKKVTVHSWNPAGAERMVQMLKDFGCKAIFIPFSPSSS